MFTTRAADRYSLPQGHAEPDADYWRSLSVGTASAWYMLSVRPTTDHRFYKMMVIKCAFDVADALDSTPVDVASLLCIAPPAFSETDDGWTAFSVAELWRAKDASRNDDPCIVLVSDDGRERCGAFGEPRPGLVKTRLVARITRRRDTAGCC